jgi:hypothetical protein
LSLIAVVLDQARHENSTQFISSGKTLTDLDLIYWSEQNSKLYNGKTKGIFDSLCSAKTCCCFNLKSSPLRPTYLDRYLVHPNPGQKVAKGVKERVS